MRLNVLKFWAMILIGGLLLLLLGYSGFQLKRWFNFKFGYESSVKAVIEQVVKKECLK